MRQGWERQDYGSLNMTNSDDVRRLAESAMATMGKIDILVNNAGANVPHAIDQIRDEDWDRLAELNLTSCMALSLLYFG